MKQQLSLVILILLSMVAYAQKPLSFDEYKKQQEEQFNSFKNKAQADYDAFRQKVNQEYADFMRKAWKEFEVQEPLKPEPEPVVEPIIREEPEPEPKPQPKPEPEPEIEPEPEDEPQPQEEPEPQPQPEPEPEPEPEPIPVQPTVIIVPEPEPAPEPIAPVQPQKVPYKTVSLSYFGTLVSVAFPENDGFHINGLTENDLADAWQQLSQSKYDVTTKSALAARDNLCLCDWAYMKLLQEVTEKQYKKSNEAILMQAFLLVQSGYRIRFGVFNNRLELLVASDYEIYDYSYYKLDNTNFYVVSGDKCGRMRICESKYGKERALSMQIAQLPNLEEEQTPKRTLSSKKGVTSSVSVNKNLLDFFNTYPSSAIDGNFTTRWAAYANTPLEQSIKDMLYPPLKRTISQMNQYQAVNILLNWVQTSFVYEYDDKVWGGDRAFFAQETLFYPYCDCEDRSILFSRLVRDLTGLEVVLLYYPGHLATAVAFTEDVKGDYLIYNKKKYIVCDPTYINSNVGETMPSMKQYQAQVIVL
ncbi:MAG: hypothetical protein IJS00_01490 [Paludibacteraceae bacterium]|nr:hypothetical protein [Paludibacteraceae bacterium]